MPKNRAITKRQDFVIKQLHQIAEVRKLAELNKMKALERAEQIKSEMELNIEPFLLWQNAINTLIKELKK